MSEGLSKIDIHEIIYKYIGVDSGYLMGFSYDSHRKFYSLYCGLDIDPEIYDPPTRERMIKVLENQNPSNQAKILRGILRKISLDTEPKPVTRTKELYDWIDKLASRLETGSHIPFPEISNPQEALILALEDIKLLLNNDRPVSCVDRAITILTAQLKSICKETNIDLEGDESMAQLFKLLKTSHPSFIFEKHLNENEFKIINSLGSIIDSLQTIRNHNSLAHANENMVDVIYAQLVINSVFTIMNFLVSLNNKSNLFVN